MPSVPAIAINGLTHRYGDHAALSDVSFSVESAEIFGLLGPNGGGKTTLFQVVSTLLPIQAGSVQLHGCDAATQADDVRRLIGVTFQAPSLDGKLTVRENLVHQGHLYGLSGKSLRDRIAQQLERLGLSDRAHDRAESLSGGLKRRVEIAKGLLHDPRVLLLDEPSTGLDPGARHDLWQYLQQLRTQQHVTVMVTTHLMEEAERCDRLGILDSGKLAAMGSPAELRASVGGDCLTISTPAPEELAEQIQQQFQSDAHVVGGNVRIEHENGPALLAQLVDAFPTEIETITLGKPTLEDVFIARTGHRFWETSAERS